MKSVLISIQPKWVAKIISGQKTIEVRKTKPKIDTPFKCYIYETNWKDNSYYRYYHRGKLGKVIGEFICDKVYHLPFSRAFEDYDFTEIYKDNIKNYFSLKSTCLTQNEIYEYGKGSPLYGWHISNLVIYDKPKELSEFKNLKGEPITRAFQSWGYVYEKDN